MSKNKKIVILITTLVIVALGIAGIFIYKNRKVDNIVIGENNKNQMQENNESANIINNENIIENTVENNVEQSNHVEDNTTSQNQAVEESKTVETTQPVQEKNVKTSAKKENNKTTTSKQQTTQEKTPSQPQKSEPSSKSEQTTTPVKNNDNSYKEQEVQIAPKTECVGNNHKIGAGNTGKWFETQEQAAAYFKTEIAKWGKQWENFEITDEEYHKNCPYGYEVWTCPQCQKWTVNFYYNK